MKKSKVEINDERLSAKNESSKEELIDLIQNVLVKGAAYVIKSMPVNTQIRDILLGIKRSIEEKDFSQIIRVALTSSISQGMETIGITEADIRTLSDLADTAYEGGLQANISLGIGVLEKAKAIGNIFYTEIKQFFSNLKSFVNSKEFRKKLDAAIEKCQKRIDEFKALCGKWHSAYEKFNLSEIESVAKILKRDKYKVALNDECQTENSLIQNVTEMVTRNKSKLTKNQYEIFENMK